MKAKSIILNLILLTTMGLTLQSCFTLAGGFLGATRAFEKKDAPKVEPPVDLQVTLEALDTIEQGTKLEVLLKDGRFFKGRFQDYTTVEFPDIAPYNELILKKKRKIIKMKTDKIHEIVIPAKKKIQSPFVKGLLKGGAIDLGLLIAMGIALEASGL